MLHLNRWDQFSCLSATAAFGSELKRAPPAKQRARSGRLADATVTKLRVRERSFWSGWKMMENVQEMPIIFRYDSDLSIILLRVSVCHGFLHMDTYKEKTGVQLYKPTFLGGSCFFCQKKKLSVGNPVSSSTNCVDCVGGVWQMSQQWMWHFFCATVTSCYIYCECGSNPSSQKMYVYIYIYMYIGIISYPHYGLVNVGYIPTIFASKSWFDAVFWWFFWWPGSTSWWPGGSVMWFSNIRLTRITRMAGKKPKTEFWRIIDWGSPISRDPSWSLLVGIIRSSFQTLHWTSPALSTFHVSRSCSY